MAEILLKGSEARSHASRMRAAAEDADHTITRLTSELDALSESFRGDAQRAFSEKYTEWSTGQKKAKEALEDLSRWLDKAADQLEELDTQLASGLQ
jgi:WXG100 family type VII secretion target